MSFMIWDFEMGIDEDVVLARRKARQIASLLDLSMPGLPGESVLRELKRDPSTAGIPVVVATSTVLSPEHIRNLMSDAAAIVSKTEMSADGARHLLHDALAAAGAGAR